MRHKSSAMTLKRDHILSQNRVHALGKSLDNRVLVQSLLFEMEFLVI